MKMDRYRLKESIHAFQVHTIELCEDASAIIIRGKSVDGSEESLHLSAKRCAELQLDIGCYTVISTDVFGERSIAVMLKGHFEDVYELDNLPD